MARALAVAQTNDQAYLSSVPDWLEGYVDVSACGCWKWNRRPNAWGYGQRRIGSRTDGSRRSVGAHRWVYERMVAPIPLGMMVLHHCDIPACVNPAHLYVGTSADNMADAARRNRFSITKLSPDQAKAAVRMCETMLQKDVARHFGVSKQCINNMMRGRSRRVVLAGG